MLVWIWSALCQDEMIDMSSTMPTIGLRWNKRRNEDLIQDQKVWK